MELLTPGMPEYDVAVKWIEWAVQLAHGRSRCLKSHCGSVIVSPGGQVIGEGFNSPPGDRRNESCRCGTREFSERFASDRTDCVHAEQRAIIDALRSYPHQLAGATLYFARAGTDGQLQHSRVPRCTICSKLILEVGIKYFIMWRAEGITRYPAAEFNELSFAY